MLLIGIDFKIRTMEVRGKMVKVQIWWACLCWNMPLLCWFHVSACLKRGTSSFLLQAIVQKYLLGRTLK